MVTWIARMGNSFAVSTARVVLKPSSTTLKMWSVASLLVTRHLMEDATNKMYLSSISLDSLSVMITTS